MAAKIDIDFARIKAFAFDVDGVFTDGGIFCDLAGELFTQHPWTQYALLVSIALICL